MGDDTDRYIDMKRKLKAGESRIEEDPEAEEKRILGEVEGKQWDALEEGEEPRRPVWETIDEYKEEVSLLEKLGIQEAEKEKNAIPWDEMNGQ